MDDIDWAWTPFAGLSTGDLYALLALRQRVFVVEQACAFLDADGLDARAFHLLGRTRGDGALVAYARVFAPGVKDAEATIGRVCTAGDVRGTGLGRRLMVCALSRAHGEFGPVSVRLWAQARLRAFYESLGYAVDGPAGMEDGILHVPMVRPA